MIYGDLPEDLGLIDLSPVEMMFWMYCPIQLPRSDLSPTRLSLPANLKQYWPIIWEVARREGGDIYARYVYLTAKTLWVEGGNIGNRPGWHSDGFGTGDVNYIWYDRAPTEFIKDSFTLPDDCTDAMVRMAERAMDVFPVRFPDKHLLRLTPSCIHRSPVAFEPGMRTFVKVSISKDRYNLEGNSVNHGLGEAWPLVPRLLARNHPSRAA